MKTQRRIAGLLLAGALSVVGLGAVSASAFADYRQIVNYGSGKCAGLDPSEYYYNGATVVQQTCNGSPEQMWSDLGVWNGYTRFVNGRSGKCLDVRDGRNADWTPVQQWSCGFANGMYWKATVPSSVPLRVTSKIGGRCLDVRGGSLEDGAIIQIYRCTDHNTAQAWTILP